MSLNIDSNGMTIDNLTTIINDLTKQFKAIYGDDILVDSNTPDGQRIGIHAIMIYHMQQILLDTYNSFDIDLASGVNLERLLKIIGILRRPSVKSEWKITITSTEDFTLPSLFTIQDSLNQKWELDKDWDLKKGDNIVSFKSQNAGVIQGLKGDKLEPLTIFLQITKLTATENAVEGIIEESDVSLKNRFRKSKGINSYSTIGTIYAKLNNVPNVRDVKIYENTKDTTVDGIPSHTYWIVIQGGDDKVIGELIAKNKTGGTGLKGDVIVNYIETLKRKDGTTYTVTIETKFDRPIVKELHISFNYKSINSNIELDINKVIDNIMSYDFKIGEAIVASKFYQLGYLNQDNLILENLKISKDGTNFVNDKIDVERQELYHLIKTNIKANKI